MDWNDQQQSRFDELREQEMVGALTNAEQTELDGMMAVLIEEADEALVSAIGRLQQEQAELEAKLQKRQFENEELAKLLLQQEQLAAESRQWLVDFDRRHAQIRETYIRLTGELLTSV